MYKGRVADAISNREGAIQYDNDPRGAWEETREIRGMESTPVADIYFSQQNLDAVQEGIRWRVHVQSNGEYTISKQNETELKIVMRSIFLQEGRNDPYEALTQVRELNAKVLSFCVPRIINEISIYKKYQNDITQLPVPMARGEIATSKGSRVLNMGPQYDA